MTDRVPGRLHPSPPWPIGAPSFPHSRAQASAAPALDPEIAALLDGAPMQPLGPDLLGTTRDRLAEGARSYRRTGAARSTDVVVAASDGSPVPVRVHWPIRASGPLPAVIWLHGGGLVAGSHLMEDWRFDRWCQRLDVVGLAVGYGLAPERPFPGPLEDVMAVLRWCREQSDELGVVPDQIGIGGSSAGGGLAAGAALLARDLGGPPLAFQALVYPMLDDRLVTASSRWDVPIWPPASNEFGWSCYLGSRRGNDDVPHHAAPARAVDLRGLPPTLIQVGAADGFLDEDVAYASRLAHAGVPVDLRVHAGAPHGFDLFFPGSRVARRARAELEAWIGSQVGRSGS